MIRGLLLAMLTFTTVACGIPTVATPAAPATTAYDTIPWCTDSSGHSWVYPCRWDARERRPNPPWDRAATWIAIWIPREIGCAGLFATVRTPEVTPSVAWSCYYAPEETP